MKIKFKGYVPSKRCESFEDTFVCRCYQDILDVRCLLEKDGVVVTCMKDIENGDVYLAYGTLVAYGWESDMSGRDNWLYVTRPDEFGRIFHADRVY